ncbi:DeoR/GlpR family DNA-binding transcription regulator [Agarivorans gilvus]|uniref:HTH-type transcriptional repressor GlcR n=1 Tax=Agarivorans gilvus TaxID=680279 RepID=A0ABQ1I6A6_9ALTE|nr:DeoR/GlpR family DNA-binding transcription regulator [Agarivorans gilvus]GGB20925.1 HTH-type transcriptional repressor GlcR [Agarivorans gilvus]
MTQEERLIALEAQIKQQGKVTIDEICRDYQISYDSARRDLVKLSSRPGILRIRGGAILDEKIVSLPYSQRAEADPIKQKLAAFGASLVNPQDVLFIDAGTTCASLAYFLDKACTVITNSLECLNALSDKAEVKKCVLGGSFDDFSHTILGEMTIAQIKKYQVNKAFIGVSALSESGISTDLETDANLKLAMAKQAKQVICIADASKFNTQLMYQSCAWSDIDFVISNQRPPENIQKQIEAHGVELIICPT